MIFLFLFLFVLYLAGFLFLLLRTVENDKDIDNLYDNIYKIFKKSIDRNLKNEEGDNKNVTNVLKRS